MALIALSYCLCLQDEGKKDADQEKPKEPETPKAPVEEKETRGTFWEIKTIAL